MLDRTQESVAVNVLELKQTENLPGGEKISLVTLAKSSGKIRIYSKDLRNDSA